MFLVFSVLCFWRGGAWSGMAPPPPQFRLLPVAGVAWRSVAQGDSLQVLIGAAGGGRSLSSEQSEHSSFYRRRIHAVDI